MHSILLPSLLAALSLLLVPAHAQCRNITYLFGDHSLGKGDIADFAVSNTIINDFTAYDSSAFRTTNEGLEMFMVAPSVRYYSSAPVFIEAKHSCERHREVGGPMKV